MNSQHTVAIQDWKALYEAAIAFKKLKCWEWMYDSDLFGVQNPETGEIGYCCVLGHMGEVLALNVYLGTEGLNSYKWVQQQGALMQRNLSADPLALLSVQKCLMASYENRSELSKKDLEIIRALGLKFRGKKEWPMFRSYQPDYLPRPLHLPEVRFLTTALIQAQEVALRVKENPDLLEPPAEGEERYLARILKGGEWQDSWLPPAELEKAERVSKIDEVLLAKLKRSKWPHKGVWEMDCMPMPTPVKEGDSAFFPYAMPVLNEQGIVLDMQLFNPDELEGRVANRFLELIQNVQYLPQSLLVGSQLACDLLEPIAKELKITLEQTGELPHLAHFLGEMEAFLLR